MPRKPSRFHGFVGQKESLNHTRRLLEGVMAQGKPFPHSTFYGPSGCGKTKLAQALATEYGTTCIQASGHDDLPTLCAKIQKLNACDMLFIDEAHNLSDKAQELLYAVIDNSEIPYWAHQSTKPAGAPHEPPVPVKPCSFILATDQPSKLRDALKKRMTLTVRLRLYNRAEMREIVDAMSRDAGLLMKAQAATRIAEISGGIPRKARHHIEKLSMFYPEAHSQDLTLEDIRRYLKSAGIDAEGLESEHRQYLIRLADFGKASLDSIAISLRSENPWVRYEIESQLIQKGLIRIGSGGRELTPKGLAWIKTKNNNNPKTKEKH